MLKKSRSTLFLISSLFVSFASQAQEITQASRYSRGLALFSKGQYIVARQELSKVLDGPYRIPAQYFAASSAVRAGQEDGALMIQAFVDSYPRHILSNSAFLELGNYFYNQGLYQKALNNYEESKESKNDELYFRIGHCHFQTHRYSEASASFAKISKSSNFNLDASYFLGFIALKSNHYEKSEEHLKRAHQSIRYGELSKKLLVAVLYHQRKYEAMTAFVETELRNQEDQTVLQYTADGYYELAEYKKAKRAYQELFKQYARTRSKTNYYKAG